MIIKTTLAAAAALALTACAQTGSSNMNSSVRNTPSMGSPTTGMPAMMFTQAGLPDAVKVPAGNRVAMETVGVGQITYECKAKANMPGQFEWVFGGPDAKLMDRAGKQVGKYYGPPATWEANDGSKFTATQVAVAPAGDGNIPLQLVKANPAMGTGAMTGVTYTQRVATKGGVAPASACGASNMGAKQIVQYQADYIFYKAS
jgi:ABC-type Fe3+-hydroxamate transport system substrate-binding protein